MEKDHGVEERPGPRAEALVRDARLRARWQGCLLLSERRKFKARYATLGFSDQAKLDEGAMWAAGFAITKVTTEVEARIGALVKQAVS
jgi:hypothetical protein